MTRPSSGNGRTTGRVTVPPSEEALDRDIPSFRRRKPVVYWVVIIAVLAMVLSTVAVPVAILLG